MSTGIRKVSIIVSHSEIVDLLSELISLECVEPIEPSVTLDPEELTDLISREVMSLEDYDANMDSITLLTTQYTYTLCGWLPEQLEPQFTSALSALTCSWLIENPLPGEIDDMPIYVKRPSVFGKLRGGGRKIFEPLSKNYIM